MAAHSRAAGGASLPRLLLEKRRRAWAFDQSAVIGERNVILCVLMSILLVAFAVVFGAFVPLYLVSVSSMAPTTMSWLMSMFGLTSMAFAFLVPGSSDVLGRRPVVIAMTAIGALLASLHSVHRRTGLAAVRVLRTRRGGERRLPDRDGDRARPRVFRPGISRPSWGLTMGLGEIVGGVLSPRRLAGWVADLAIATIADMAEMVFEGKVDESEVGKLRTGHGSLLMTVGGDRPSSSSTAKLEHIAPKGVAQDGAIQFEIRAGPSELAEGGSSCGPFQRQRRHRARPPAQVLGDRRALAAAVRRGASPSSRSRPRRRSSRSGTARSGSRDGMIEKLGKVAAGAEIKNPNSASA